MNKNRILIDSSHHEEVRVALINKRNRLEELDFESSTKQTNKGNIYLAKIMRVEPSLQAAFVEYGGNRHGFLPFNEIHPDYFRIPVDDKKALEAEIAKANQELEEQQNAAEKTSTGAPNDYPVVILSEEDAVAPPSQIDVEQPSELKIIEQQPVQPEREIVERPSFHKKYKIQEVVQKNQVILIQIDKEERGQKGAAVTSYLSIPGRYCVLMPNTPTSGGVSRKITNANDRKRLREILAELNLPESMSIIIRTAGMGHSKAEIKRDSEYLFRIWDNLRNKTLNSIAPALVYEEASLIKRSIRDMYSSSDTEKIIVQGEAGFKEASEFMQELVPHQVSKVERYTNTNLSLFQNYGVDSQIEELHSHQVFLPSGGSIVIDQTEALVAIDINSGKATRERHIDATAFNTNMEAAGEIARQIKLRDLAGLIVIDFIDMDNPKYIRSVEQKLRDSMASDRARLQVGHISVFGLLELSRQRLRPSLLESSTVACPNCNGKGIIRSTESTSLEILRAIEDRITTQKLPEIKVKTSMDVAFYLLNYKRQLISSLEEKNHTSIFIEGDHTFPSALYEIPNVKAVQKQNKSQSTQASMPAVEEIHPKPQYNQQRNKKNQKYQQRYNRQAPPMQLVTNDAMINGASQPKPEEVAPAKSKTRKKSWWKQIFD